MIFHNSFPEKQKNHYQQMKETEIEIERFFVLFSNMWKRRAIYMVERIEERADLYLTPTFTLKNRDVK